MASLPSGPGGHEFLSLLRRLAPGRQHPCPACDLPGLPWQASGAGRLTAPHRTRCTAGALPSDRAAPHARPPSQPGSLCRPAEVFPGSSRQDLLGEGGELQNIPRSVFRMSLGAPPPPHSSLSPRELSQGRGSASFHQHTEGGKPGFTAASPLGKG